MGPRKEDLIEVAALLAEQEDLKATVAGASKAALMAGACTFVGAMLGGPLGVLVGGSIGTVGATMYSKGQFRSVVSIIREDMTEAQKMKLAVALGKILTSIDAADVTAMIAFITLNPSIKAVVLKELGTFLKNEMYLTMS